ncbi:MULTISPECIES: hypothetical protein [Actinokineospora]|uniref:Uncharacterized protein n=1 Tax=Actinokineospora fastidiosa TaxID=1816 RepID=A0A918G391_9PSEU|nr:MULTISPECIES: hypothetical protein [Actinokineospora]UVS76563.1 hypothetical protein Actkin_00255 [Actinokineospora sp. UTMC 2448]GGS17339.1 hypothetical protein GCM10010171_07110 [Actinokineospora fastidiosa]
MKKTMGVLAGLSVAAGVMIASAGTAAAHHDRRVVSTHSTQSACEYEANQWRSGDVGAECVYYAPYGNWRLIIWSIHN